MNKKMKKSVKILSCITALMMTVTMTAASTFAYADTEQNTKEETVYVITNVDGSNKETIVSDHLYNKSSSDSIADVSPLTNIKNVKGDEKFTQGEDGSLTWNAKGNDIYYQGNTENTAPVSMSIKYYLDDKEVTGEQLEGKTGKVKLVIDYKNNQSVNVNGKSVNVPFVVMTGFMAEDDCFKNVTINSGKVIDDGEKQIIIGMAVPGLADSLGVPESKIGFSDELVIEGDANKFSVDSMMTIVTNDIFEDIDTGKLGELNMDQQINQLDSAAKKLVAGSTTLYDGIHMLNDKSQQLSAGVTDLNKGSQKLLKGINDAKAGAEQAATGSAAVYKGVLSVQTAVDGDGTDGNPGLLKGMNSVVNGLVTSRNTLQSGMNADDSAMTALNTLKTTYNINENDPNYQALVKAIGTSKTCQQGVYDSMQDNTGALKVGVDTIDSGLSQLSSRLKGDGTALNPGLVPVTDKVNNGVASLAVGLGATVNSSSVPATDETLYGGALALADGMNQLNSSTGALLGGINSLDLGSKELNAGMQQFYEQGIAKLVKLYNSDLKGIMSNMNAVIKAGQQYDTFTQLPDTMNGSVKFIYKTEIS